MSKMLLVASLLAAGFIIPADLVGYVTVFFLVLLLLKIVSNVR